MARAYVVAFRVLLVQFVVRYRDLCVARQVCVIDAPVHSMRLSARERYRCRR